MLSIRQALQSSQTASRKQPTQKRQLMQSRQTAKQRQPTQKRQLPLSRQTAKQRQPTQKRLLTQNRPPTQKKCPTKEKPPAQKKQAAAPERQLLRMRIQQEIRTPKRKAAQQVTPWSKPVSRSTR